MTINWFLWKRLTRALWFLPALFSMFALLVVAAAFFSTYFFPDGLEADDLPITVSREAVLSILTIIASSMLAVAVFSLSTLVSLISSASTSTSPRAVSLIVEDRTAQTSISVFIGAFLFSVVAIIGLSGEIYSTSGRLILFGATVVVVLAVVWALIRWIGHISVVGRVGETVHRVETATATALERFQPDTIFGCGISSGLATVDGTVRAGQIGFVQHFGFDTLEAIAEERDLWIHVSAIPGTYVDHGTVLAEFSGRIEEDCLEQMRAAFVVGRGRTFEYDPGFGLIVLAEIAQRALSPAVNDPGTAMQVIMSQTRLLGDWAMDRDGAATTPEYRRVTVAPVSPAVLLAQALHPISRDAAASADVTIALLRGLRTLAEGAPADLGAAARHLAGEIVARAPASLPFRGDVDAVGKAAAWADAARGEETSLAHEGTVS
jgi:uncharacterized membrane protein